MELGTLIAVGVAAVAWVRRRAQGAVLALAALGFSWFALVAVMTEAGFAGNQRYLMVTTAAVSVLGGVGAVRVLQGVELLGRALVRQRARGRRGRRRSAFVCGLAIASPTIVAKANNTGRVQGGIEHEAFLWHDLKALIDANGGKDRLLACGGVFSGPFQTQMVAYELGIHGINVGWKVTPAPGRRVPHAHGAGRPARDEADRRPLPARRPAGQVAAADRAPGRATSRTPARSRGRTRRRRRPPRSPARAAQGRGHREMSRGALTRIARWQASLPVHERCRGSAPCRTASCCPRSLLLGLLAVSAYLRTNSLGESLWMDEGLSIGIASQPLFDIPGILRMDGSPPLYYMLLSVWMDVFGDGPAETQALSVAISLLAIPGGLWAGWSLFGRRAGLYCAALCAVNPFLTAYAQETRMYSLMLVMSLLATAAFLHVFAFGRRRLPAAVHGPARRDALHAQLGPVPRRRPRARR